MVVYLFNQHDHLDSMYICVRGIENKMCLSLQGTLSGQNNLTIKLFKLLGLL